MEWNNHIISADGHTVCFMAHNPDNNTALENAARLIAAAPELLEALKACRERLSFVVDLDETASADIDAFNMAEAAIAKAEGEV